MKTISPHDEIAVRDQVRETYGRIAAGKRSSCCSTNGSGSGNAPILAADALGYAPDEVAALPDGAYLGLSCGNPQAIAALQPGETVLDLGSGAGFDCLLAARSVGPAGRVIGVDMTPEMLGKARANAAKAGVTNVEFRPGEIEALPVEANSVDVIISNCVVNLSPDKPRVFREAYRVLKPGGRLAIADILRTADIPKELAGDLAAHCACVAGAVTADEIETMLLDAGFTRIRVSLKGARTSPFLKSWTGAKDFIASATVEAVKAGDACCASGCCQ